MGEIYLFNLIFISQKEYLIKNIENYIFHPKLIIDQIILTYSKIYTRSSDKIYYKILKNCNKKAGTNSF